MNDKTKSAATPSPRTDGNLLSDQVNEIRALEERLIDLKQNLVLRSATVANDTELSFLLMRIGVDLMAAPISQVEEVLEMPALTPLDNEVRTVSGLVNYHGDMLAVIDLAELMGKARSQVSADRILAICSVSPRRFGLMIDEALEVVRVERSAVTISDQVLPGLLRAQGVLRLEDRRSAMIIDLSWIAMGAQLAKLLSGDSATPIERGES